MIRIHPLLFVLCIAVAFPAITLADQTARTDTARTNDDGPCGGKMELTEGEVILKQPIPLETPLSQVTRTCLQAIAAAVVDRPYIRSMTVAARVSDEQRVAGKGLELANAVAKALTDAGIPERRISAVSPAIGHGQDPGVVLVYRERHNTERVASIVLMSGVVETGKARDSMRRARARQDLVTHDYLRTQENSAAMLRLADESRLYLGPDSMVRLGKVGLDETLRRQVQLDLAAGEVIVFAAPHKDSAVFEITTRTAVAGVRGTEFRFATDGLENGGSRLETLEGAVEFKKPADPSSGQPAPAPVVVDKGFGSVVKSGGAPTPPRPLLPGAILTGPLLGAFPTPPTLQWQAVSGATAYRIEFARDAKFVGELKQWTETGTSAKLDASLPSGKWFWHVQAIDADGLIGVSSKIYAFEVRR